MGTNIHASCIVLDRAGVAFGAPEDAGVLLLGPSGAGKSDLALRLIGAGAVLVSDDRTDLSIHDGRLVARAPSRLAGLIEVRNLGILALPHRSAARVTLAVDLTPHKPLSRLPDRTSWTPPGLSLAASRRPPLIRLDPFEISAPAKIAVATAAFAHGLFRETVAPM
jgi:hypothetical protein